MNSKDKRTYPSVTQVLGYFTDTSWYTEESRIRGTDVHDFCHQLVTKDLTKAEAISISNKDSSKYGTFYKSFISWYAACDPLPLVAEERLVDKEQGFTGKPDFIGTMKGKTGLGLIDFKTSSHIHPQWQLQIAAYVYLASIAGLPIDWGATLLIHKDGKTAKLEYVFAFNSTDNKYLKALQEIFSGLLRLVKRKDEKDNSWKL